jgi:hypothetical protein
MVLTAAILTQKAIKEELVSLSKTTLTFPHCRRSGGRTTTPYY